MTMPLYLRAVRALTTLEMNVHSNNKKINQLYACWLLTKNEIIPNLTLDQFINMIKLRITDMIQTLKDDKQPQPFYFVKGTNLIVSVFIMGHQKNMEDEASVNLSI